MAKPDSTKWIFASFPDGAESPLARHPGAIRIFGAARLPRESTRVVATIGSAMSWTMTGRKTRLQYYP
jgi:hypothetical protein